LAGAKARLRRLAADVPGSEVDCRAVLGDPGEELPALAEDVGADLIVLRLRRGHGLFGKKQGSITYRVLCGSAIPVLALAPGR
jgi:nucleotide-binding universal stress UspA family protein